MVAEFLTLMDVGDVHLDGRDGSRENCIEDRNRSRGVACGIDDDASDLLRLGLVKPVDEFALAIGLTEVDLQSIAFGRLAAQLLDVLEGRMAVFLRLARAERIQVRPVEDVDRFGHESTGARPGSSGSDPRVRPRRSRRRCRSRSLACRSSQAPRRASCSPSVLATSSLFKSFSMRAMSSPTSF